MLDEDLKEPIKQPTLKPKPEEPVENGRDVRIYIASSIFVFLLILLMLYLTYIPVPGDNKDLIVTIIGVLVGGAASAMNNLFGSKDEEKEALKRKFIELEKDSGQRITALEKKLIAVQAEYEELDARYRSLVDMLVKRHVVDAEGIEYSHRI